jgi:DNA-binding GntR family transcriptional regulator
MEEKEDKKRKVEPIKSFDDLAKIRRMLRKENRPRDLLLFDLVTQTGARIRSLIELKVQDLIALETGDYSPVWEGSLVSPPPVVMTETVRETFRWYLETLTPQPDEWLFKSRKGRHPLDPTTVSHLIDKWYGDAGLEGLIGARSLYKTYQVYFRTENSHGTKAQKNTKRFLEPVRATTLRQQAYNNLLQAILSGLILPGERLVAHEIAKQMNVSAMPIREAMAHLEAQGFVHRRRNRAFVVDEISYEKFIEIANIRLTLERLATEMACPKCSEETIRLLKLLHEKYTSQFTLLRRSRSDLDMIHVFFNIHKQWHLTLYRDAGMPILTKIIEEMWNRLGPYWCLILNWAPDNELESIINDDHLVMIDGMKRRDVKKVIQLLESSIRSGMAFIKKHYKQLQLAR